MSNVKNAWHQGPEQCEKQQSVQHPSFLPLLEGLWAQQALFMGKKLSSFSVDPAQGAVGCAQGLLGGIRDKQRKLQEAHERTKTVTRTGEMKEIRERMQDDIEEVNKAARTVKLRLERLDKTNEQAVSRKARPRYPIPCCCQWDYPDVLMYYLCCRPDSSCGTSFYCCLSSLCCTHC